MNIFYSKEKGGFYNPAINGFLPPDAVVVSAEEYTALLTAQSTGKVIQANEAGFPIAVDPPPQPPVVPTFVTMRQARLALLQAGKLQMANEVIVTMTGTEGEAARVEWDYASEVWRNQPLVTTLALAVGLTHAELDDLFVLAATL